MKNNENLENEEITKEEEGLTVINDFTQLSKRTDTKSNIFTNITDKKKIFNLDSKVDVLLNDCENEMIHVKEILIKKFEKPLKEPIVDEDTGEIIKDSEISMACILIDDNNKSYATGSKIFSIQMMRYLEMFGIDESGFDIKIIKKKYGDNGNKALGFE